MNGRTTPLRLRTLLTWSSPVLILTLLVGVNGRAAHSPSTSTSPLNAESSANAHVTAVDMRGPLATNLQGAVGPADPDVIVPLNTTRPWLVQAPHIDARIVCGARIIRVTSVVTAPSPNCQLDLSAIDDQTHRWTLQLLP